MTATFVRSTASCLPPAVPVADFLAAGATTEADLARSQVTSVTVSADLSAADMAVLAGRAAIERCGGSSEFGLTLHADVYHQGRDMWAVASYVQQQAVGRTTAPALEVRQMSNGSLAALAMADRWLRADGSADVLITAADRFCPPGFDRFGTDVGTVYADGAAAAVLSGTSGWAKLRAVVLRSDSALEPMHRNGDQDSVADRESGGVIDFEKSKRRFLAEVGVGFAVQRAAAGQEAVMRDVLERADTTLSTIDHFVLPHFGHQRLSSIYFAPFGIEPERTTWEWSRGVGHLGAADQLAGLERLTATGRLNAGDLIMLLGVGAGYSWGAAVLEILEKPCC